MVKVLGTEDGRILVLEDGVTPLELEPGVLPAQYLLLEPHYINNQIYETGTTLSESAPNNNPPIIGQLPTGWIPTLAVDPLTTAAVQNFYNAGPRGIAWENLNEFGGLYAVRVGVLPSQVIKPVTYWQRSGGAYILTGLGAGYPPKV